MDALGLWASRIERRIRAGGDRLQPSTEPTQIPLKQQPALAVPPFEWDIRQLFATANA